MSKSVPIPASHTTEEEVLRRLGFSTRQCANMARRAAALGVGIETVAFNWGFVEERIFYEELATHLGIGFVANPFSVDRGSLSVHAAEAGIVRTANAQIIAAPRGVALRRFLRDRPERCLLTSPFILRASLRAAFATDAAMHASGALPVLAPQETAQRDGHAAGFVVAAWFSALSALVLFEPLVAAPITVPIGLLYAWMVGQRVLSIVSRHQTTDIDPSSLSPRDLPVYSVLVALYREDNVLAQLIGALEALDYPPEKLEILFLVEEEDMVTRQAFAAIELLPFMRLVTCPKGLPRTKPRALNIGLRECTGEFVAIFDAEDRPDPDQLLKAVACFCASPPEIACLQAEIMIENGNRSFWTRGFSLEYAALFQLVVPGLCRFHLPVALGGTSNHFRRDALLALNGWDAWNVTEDADLGLRFALHGYRVAHLQSCTWEEAPADFQTWRKQRTRWIKGWMQTSHVHLPQLLRRMHRLPASQTIGILHHLVGTPVAALLTPLFTGALIMGWLSEQKSLIETGIVAYGSAIACAALLMMIGLFRCARPALSARHRLRAWMEAPFYLLLVCFCAWMALAELVRAPFRWNKTPHGQASPQAKPTPPPRRTRSKGRRTRNEFRHKSLPSSRHAQAPPRL